jgi:Flp pilus assembly pilin Flp
MATASQLTRRVVVALVRRDRGQTMAEYGIILAVVALMAIPTIGLLGDEVLRLLGNAIDRFAETTG